MRFTSKVVVGPPYAVEAYIHKTFVPGIRDDTRVRIS